MFKPGDIVIVDREKWLRYTMNVGPLHENLTGLIVAGCKDTYKILWDNGGISQTAPCWLLPAWEQLEDKLKKLGL